MLRAFGIDGVPPHRAQLSFPESDAAATTDYLTHPVFHMNRAESEMMRYHAAACRTGIWRSTAR